MFLNILIFYPFRIWLIPRVNYLNRVNEWSQPNALEQISATSRRFFFFVAWSSLPFVFLEIEKQYFIKSDSSSSLTLENGRFQLQVSFLFVFVFCFLRRYNPWRLAFFTPLFFRVTILAFLAPPKFRFGFVNSSKSITGAEPIRSTPETYRASTFSLMYLLLFM